MRNQLYMAYQAYKPYESITYKFTLVYAKVNTSW